MAIPASPLVGGHLAMAPENIVAPVGPVGSQTRIMIGGYDAAARYFESIHNHKSACGNDFGMRVECDGPLGAQCQLRDFISSDEELFLFARDHFESGRIDDLLDG